MMATKRHGSAFVAMLAQLAKDPRKAAAFKRNPEAVMNAHGLSDAQKARLSKALADLKAGKTASMRRLVADETVHPDTCILTIP
jgi:hypothetical protein